MMIGDHPIARRLFTLLAVCVLGSCGSDSSPTGVGGDPSDGRVDNPGNGGGNSGGGDEEAGNTDPIFNESRSTLRIVSMDTPDTLRSGSQPISFSVTVEDSGQFVDPIDVVMRLSRGDSVWTLSMEESIDASTALFGTTFDSTLAAGLSGDQTLQFQAVDADGGGSMMVTKGIYLENEPPVLFNPRNPARMENRSQDRIQVNIMVSDPQGPADIDSVYFKFLKPDGNFGADGFHFLLLDNGDEDLPFRDEVAGDGCFSFNFPILPDALLGSYQFLFFSRDKAGNLTSPVTTSFELVPLER